MSFNAPLTDLEKFEQTEAIIDDLIHRTESLSEREKLTVILRLKEIWEPSLINTFVAAMLGRSEE